VHSNNVSGSSSEKLIRKWLWCDLAQF